MNDAGENALPFVPGDRRRRFQRRRDPPADAEARDGRHRQAREIPRTETRRASSSCRGQVVTVRKAPRDARARARGLVRLRPERRGLDPGGSPITIGGPQVRHDSPIFMLKSPGLRVLRVGRGRTRPRDEAAPVTRDAAPGAPSGGLVHPPMAASSPTTPAGAGICARPARSTRRLSRLELRSRRAEPRSRVGETAPAKASARDRFSAGPARLRREDRGKTTIGNRR